MIIEEQGLKENWYALCVSLATNKTPDKAMAAMGLWNGSKHKEGEKQQIWDEFWNDKVTYKNQLYRPAIKQELYDYKKLLDFLGSRHPGVIREFLKEFEEGNL